MSRAAATDRAYRLLRFLVEEEPILLCKVDLLHERIVDERRAWHGPWRLAWRALLALVVMFAVGNVVAAILWKGLNP